MTSKVKGRKPPTQVKGENEDLLDIALGGPGGVSLIAAARVVIRGIADQIFILTNIGNEPLDGFVAHGFGHALRQVDRDQRVQRREIKMAKEKKLDPTGLEVLDDYRAETLFEIGDGLEQTRHCISAVAEVLAYRGEAADQRSGESGTLQRGLAEILELNVEELERAGRHLARLRQPSANIEPATVTRSGGQQ